MRSAHTALRCGARCTERAARAFLTVPAKGALGHTQTHTDARGQCRTQTISSDAGMPVSR